MKRYKKQFWREIEYELDPYKLTPGLRRGISFALRHAIWEHEDDLAQVQAELIDWATIERDGRAFIETLYPTHGELHDFHDRLSTVAQAIAALPTALKTLDDWPDEQRAREELPSPHRPGKQRDNENGRERGHEPFAPYAAEHRSALDHALAAIGAAIERDLALYRVPASVIADRSPRRGRRPDERRRRLVANVLMLLQREGIPVKQTNEGTAARVLRVIFCGYQSVLEGKPLKKCRAPKHMKNDIRSAQKFPKKLFPVAFGRLGLP